MIDLKHNVHHRRHRYQKIKFLNQIFIIFQDRSDASANENVRSNASTTPTNAEEIRPEQISMVRKLWNSFYLCTQFFVTLFTSLVPERIQPLDLN